MFCFSHTKLLCILKTRSVKRLYEILKTKYLHENKMYSGPSTRGINQVVSFKRLFLIRNNCLFFPCQIITKLSDKRNGIKVDFQSVSRSLGTPMVVSLDEMRINVIRYEPHALWYIT